MGNSLNLSAPFSSGLIKLLRIIELMCVKFTGLCPALGKCSMLDIILLQNNWSETEIKYIVRIDVKLC